MKYILVTGGVISGIGKGVIASSLGAILKHWGLEVTSVKIDPYLNIDAGTFSPYEHGEVYVLDDGGEVDLDLGNYERFLDITLTRDNNLTTGKIFMSVIEKERQGQFLGKTVQVVPHITDAIQDWVERVSRTPVSSTNKEPEICIVELGGTIGDIEGMHFVEAFRQFQFRVKQENLCVMHVSLVPQPNTTGEHKTKPTQASVRELRGLGLSPDFIVCRSENQITEEVKKKISNFCHVQPQKVVCLHDAESIYSVPLMLEEQNLSEMLNERLGLSLPDVRPPDFMSDWKSFVRRTRNFQQKVSIALVGKYTGLGDAYASVNKALNHAAIACRRKLELVCVDSEDLEQETKLTKPGKHFDAWKLVVESNGILVPGGFGPRGIEGKIAVCNWARTNKHPFLGVCLGMQAAVIEFARNVVGITDAHSQEMKAEAPNLLVVEMPEFNPGQMGGTMRLGRRRTVFTGQPSKMQKLYGNPPHVEERHRHRYEVNPSYVETIESNGMNFVGKDTTGERMEIFEVPSHPFYVGVQYHPEYLTRPLKPSPPYLGLLLAACGKLDAHLAKMPQHSSKDVVTSTILSDEDTEEEKDEDSK